MSKLGRHTKAFYRDLYKVPAGYDKTYTMYAKYKGTCWDCGRTVHAGSKMVYNATLKAVRHMNCMTFTKEYVNVARHQKF